LPGDQGNGKSGALNCRVKPLSDARPVSSRRRFYPQSRPTHWHPPMAGCSQQRSSLGQNHSMELKAKNQLEIVIGSDYRRLSEIVAGLSR
jgi:hypothetical protein